jgi:UDPglucose 6-dehydrogenase
MVKRNVAADATITSYDPVAMNEAKRCFPNEPRLTFAANQTAALEGADALIIVTEWREWRVSWAARTLTPSKPS